MNLGTVEIVLLTVAVVAVLWMLRSTPRQGQNVLRRWGIAKPTEPQGELAAAYPKRRRNLYPWVLIGVVVLVGVARALLQRESGSWVGPVLGAIVATMLLTDLLETLRRPKQRTRTATLVERRVMDLVPVPGLMIGGLMVTAAVVAQATNVALYLAVPNLPTDADFGVTWFSFGAFVVVVAATSSLVWLGLHRAPTVDDGAVDAALRIRSVRVGVGTALLLCAGLVLSINSFEQEVVGRADAIPAWVDPVSTWVEAVVFVAALFGLFGWVGLISPWRRQRLVEASA